MNEQARRPSPEALRDLSGGVSGLRVTLVLSVPERPGFEDIESFPHRYELACRRADERLRDLGAASTRRRRIAEHLASVEADLNGLPGSTRGLAVLCGPEGAAVFLLGRPVDELVAVGRGYRLRPLVAELPYERPFRVLALALNHVVTFEGTRWGLERVELPGVPSTLEEALGDETVRSTLQVHTGGNQRQGGSVHHGQGGSEEGRQLDRERLHRVVATLLKRAWRGRNDPLVLVADDTHQGRFRKVAELPGLLPTGVSASPERMPEQELRERSWGVLEEAIAVELERERSGLQHALAHRRAVDTLSSAAAYTVQGRVERLWVDPKTRTGRHVVADSGDLLEAFGDEDALDELSALTLHHGGEVRLLRNEPRGNGNPLGNHLPGAVAAELRV